MQKNEETRLSQGEDENVTKIVTMLYLTMRIQAKIYNSDTIESFTRRVKMILLSKVDQNKEIAILHLKYQMEIDRQLDSSRIESLD